LCCFTEWDSLGSGFLSGSFGSGGNLKFEGFQDVSVTGSGNAADYVVVAQVADCGLDGF
jgi:hypothetical protein